DQVLAMTGDQWRDEVLAQGLIDEELAAAPGMLDMVVPTLRANYLLLARNPPPAGRVSCPLLVLGGAEDAGTPPGLLGLWADRTTAGCTTKMYSGGHFYYRDQLSDVCSEIREGARRKAGQSY
ncbi:MAG: thioesterase domain-containing protein, partial [Actinoplanes sp.]